MKEWLKADSPADVGKFYDDQYRKGGFDALSKGDWGEIIGLIEMHGGKFTKEKKLLEAGCGHGQFLSAVCDLVDASGFDVSQVAVDLANKRLGDKAHVSNLRMESIGFDNDFDYVVSFGAIEHTMDPKVCFDNLLTAVKPGGILVILVPLEFEDCFRYIRGETIQKTNERFGTEKEWMDLFGNKHEAWHVVGNTEMKDLILVIRKETK